MKLAILVLVGILLIAVLPIFFLVAGYPEFAIAVWYSVVAIGIILFATGTFDNYIMRKE